MRKHVCRHVRLLFSLVREPLEPLQQAFLDVCVLGVSSLFSSPRTACVRFTGGFCVASGLGGVKMDRSNVRSCCSHLFGASVSRRLCARCHRCRRSECVSGAVLLSNSFNAPCPECDLDPASCKHLVRLDRISGANADFGYTASAFDNKCLQEAVVRLCKGSLRPRAHSFFRVRCANSARSGLGGSALEAFNFFAVVEFLAMTSSCVIVVDRAKSSQWILGGSAACVLGSILWDDVVGHAEACCTHVSSRSCSLSCAPWLMSTVGVGKKKSRRGWNFTRAARQARADALRVDGAGVEIAGSRQSSSQQFAGELSGPRGSSSHVPAYQTSGLGLRSSVEYPVSHPSQQLVSFLTEVGSARERASDMPTAFDEASVALAPVPLPCVSQVISPPDSVLSIVRRVSYVVQHDRPEMAASTWHLVEGFFMLIEQGLNRHQG